MATISAYTSSSISTLFSGLNSSSSNNSFGIGSLDLSTYNSIKTGAYKQLLKSYYAKNPVHQTAVHLRQITAVQQQFHHRRLMRLRLRMLQRQLLMMQLI